MTVECSISGIGLLLYAILEWWLGKTRKTRATSLIDLVVVGLTLAGTLGLVYLKRKK